MTKTITAEEASQMFKELRLQSEGKGPAEMAALVESLRADGVIMSVESATQEPIWDDSPEAKFMEVVQENILRLSGWPVHQWTTKFYGYWGGMGAGWWTERGASTLEEWLEEFLGAGDLLPEDAEVPPPEDAPQDEEATDEEESGSD